MPKNGTEKPFSTRRIKLPEKPNSDRLLAPDFTVRWHSQTLEIADLCEVIAAGSSSI